MSNKTWTLGSAGLAGRENSAYANSNFCQQLPMPFLVDMCKGPELNLFGEAAIALENAYKERKLEIDPADIRAAVVSLKDELFFYIRTGRFNLDLRMEGKKYIRAASSALEAKNLPAEKISSELEKLNQLVQKALPVIKASFDNETNRALATQRSGH